MLFSIFMYAPFRYVTKIIFSYLDDLKTMNFDIKGSYNDIIFYLVPFAIWNSLEINESREEATPPIFSHFYHGGVIVLFREGYDDHAKVIERN